MGAIDRLEIYLLEGIRPYILKEIMQQKSNQTLFRVKVILESGKIKEVSVRAGSLEVAEARAIKRTPTGVSIQRDNS